MDKPRPVLRGGQNNPGMCPSIKESCKVIACPQYASLPYWVYSVLQTCAGKGTMIEEMSIDDVGYADDLGVLENTDESATVKLQYLNQQSMSAGMEINKGKTKPCIS